MPPSKPTKQSLQTIRIIQLAMSLCYSGLGAWCLLHPSSVITLSFRAPYKSLDYTSQLLMQFFGAQALTTGLLLGVSNMDRFGFLMFGVAMVPYMMFDLWYGIGPGRELGVFTGWLWVDFVATVGFCAGAGGCVWLLGCGDTNECRWEGNKKE
ncbi:hypothetical protein BJY04DRAFT_203928 [Aspergillus karnatakaensis]|uniref:uncharacterized protein n=1 Tax=Aspergillus karnatakaensis TaxID=1810916 RepID=UPI003CCCAE58